MGGIIGKMSYKNSRLPPKEQGVNLYCCGRVSAFPHFGAEENASIIYTDFYRYHNEYCQLKFCTTYHSYNQNKT